MYIFSAFLLCVWHYVCIVVNAQREKYIQVSYLENQIHHKTALDYREPSIMSLLVQGNKAVIKEIML